MIDLLYRDEFPMVKKLTLISFIAFIIISSKANAQENQVTIFDDISYVFVEKLVAIAKENYPRVKVHNSHIKDRETALSQAKISWLSPLSLSYVYSPSTTLNLENPTFFSGYQIGFNLNLNSILQNPGNIKRAKEELKIVNLEKEEYLLELTTEVKTRYYTYIKSFKALKIITQSYVDAQNGHSMSKYKFEKGETSLGEYTDASSRYATLTQTKLEAEVNLLVAKASLEELLGVKLEAIPN